MPAIAIHSSLSAAEVLTILGASCERIAASTRGLNSAQLRAAPTSGEWSPVEILAHLRACDDVWGSCITRIVTERHPEITALSPRTAILSTDYPRLAFRTSFAAFCDHRDRLLGVLRRLRPADWSRSATVFGGGPPRQCTALSYAQRLARHERSHLRQIERTAAEIRARH